MTAHLGDIMVNSGKGPTKRDLIEGLGLYRIKGCPTTIRRGALPSKTVDEGAAVTRRARWTVAEPRTVPDSRFGPSVELGGSTETIRRMIRAGKLRAERVH